MACAKFQIVRKCKVCGAEFVAKTLESWYCTPRCGKIAWKRRKDESINMQRLDKIVKSIPDCRDHIKISEAYALFGISKYTVYRLIKKGDISHVNLGTNQIRVNKQEQQQKFVCKNAENQNISERKL